LSPPSELQLPSEACRSEAASLSSIEELLHTTCTPERCSRLEPFPLSSSAEKGRLLASIVAAACAVVAVVALSLRSNGCGRPFAVEQRWWAAAELLLVAAALLLVASGVLYGGGHKLRGKTFYEG